MQIGLAEFLEKVSKIKRKDDRVAALKHNDSFPLRTILQGAFDPRIKWLLPPGIPPFKKNEIPDQQPVLIREARKLVYFVEGGSNLTSAKREAMFIELLENCDPNDAILLCHIKDKSLPWKGIDSDIVKQAFPEILPA